MRKLLALGLMVAAVAGMARADGTAAAPKPKAAKTVKVSGSVEAVDVAAMKLSVKDAKGAVTEFTLTAAAKIRKGGKTATLADVAAGDRADVAYKMEGDQKVVSSVMVKAPKKAAAPAKK